MNQLMLTLILFRVKLNGTVSFLGFFNLCLQKKSCQLQAYSNYYSLIICTCKATRICIVHYAYCSTAAILGKSVTQIKKCYQTDMRGPEKYCDMPIKILSIHCRTKAALCSYATKGFLNLK